MKPVASATTHAPTETIQSATETVPPLPTHTAIPASPTPEIHSSATVSPTEHSAVVSPTLEPTHASPTVAPTIEPTLHPSSTPDHTVVPPPETPTAVATGVPAQPEQHHVYMPSVSAGAAGGPEHISQPPPPPATEGTVPSHPASEGAGPGVGSGAESGVPAAGEPHHPDVQNVVTEVPYIKAVAPNGAVVDGSVVDGSLKYNGHAWNLLDNGTGHLTKILEPGVTLNNDMFAQKLQDAADLWTKGQLDPNSDLGIVFHYSNGTSGVIDSLTKNTNMVVEALKNLSVIN